MADDGRPIDAARAAIEQAYQLVESAQGHHDAALVDRAFAEAVAHGWADVVVLLHFARSLACRENGVDDTEHLEAMLDVSTSLGDQVLTALAIAAQASRWADRRRHDTGSASAAGLLVRAVVLLDGDDGSAPVVHRAAALIEIGCVAHELGFWELALEYYALTEQVLASCPDGEWSATVRRQQLVVTLNTAELALDWASALAGVGDWDGASARTTAVAADPVAEVGPRWPPKWVAQYLGQCTVLAAFAGRTVESPDSGATALIEAILAARGGDAERAATLAETAAHGVGFFLPSSTHLLMLSLIAQRPGTNPAAVRYGAELAKLRWNDRLDRMAGMREAIAVERRRRDHEQLRHDLLVDELTGLANRRGLQEYCASLDGGSAEDLACAVLMIDVDHFKSINDGYGHAMGDRVLNRLGAVLSGQVRPVDLAARLGGDEFVVIIADVPRSMADARAEQVLDAVRDFPWGSIAPGLTVSISIGVDHGAAGSLPATISSADHGLYKAKSRGRGRVAAT